jgi:GNAT superfamily N-acetyltransferase
LTPQPGATSACARLAVEGDIGRLVGLYSAAVDELSVMRGGRVLIGLNGRDGSLESSFRRQLTDPGELVVVGSLDGGVDGPESAGELSGGPPVVGAPAAGAGGNVVGYGTCRLLELSDGERVGSVQDLYVDPVVRRHGVGRAISDHMVSWCVEQGCIGVDANALPGSRAVKSFFEAGRFTARLLVMHRPLPPARSSRWVPTAPQHAGSD